ncbi:MAG: hypothetical protein JXA24_01080 [Proteobacteria bacterium]|nr:hypothetical protein [Pseudomonadota bacterium]
MKTSPVMIATPPALPTFWTAIESPADAAFLSRSPVVLRVIKTEGDLGGLPKGDPANTIACTGVPLGRIPIVPIAELKHPRLLAGELREDFLTGASAEEVRENIAIHLAAYDRLVMEFQPGGPSGCLMPWQMGKNAYAMGILEHCIGDGFCKDMRAELAQIVGIVNLFAGIAEEMASSSPAARAPAAGEQGQYRAMQRLLREMGHLQDARLAGAGEIDPEVARAIADVQRIAVMNGMYAMLVAQPEIASRNDSLRSAAYMFDLAQRYDRVGPEFKVRELDAALDVPPLREYSGIGEDGVLSRLSQEVARSVDDALEGYFDANRDVPASMDALYHFWDERYAGAYRFRAPIFEAIADELGASQEADRFRQRAEMDGRIADVLDIRL